MSDFFNSTFFSNIELQTLSQRWIITLLHFLWQGTVIGVVVGTMNRLLSRQSAAVRYRVLCLGLFAIPLSVAVTFSFVRVPVQRDAALSAATGTHELMQDQVQAETSSVGSVVDTSFADLNEVVPQFAAENDNVMQSERTFDSWVRFSPWFVTAYLIGVAYFLSRLLIVMWGGQRLRSVATPIDDSRIINLVGTVCQQAGLKLVPTVAWCERVAVPTVIGALRPAILLPASLVSGLDSQQLTAVLSHEIAHIRRYDLWINLIQRVIESLLFFHPAVWYVSRCLSNERESCCDDLVVSSGIDRLSYAGALLRVAELCAAKMQPAAATSLSVVGNDSTQLERRITRLLSTREDSRVRLNRSGAITFTVILVLALLSPAAFHRIGTNVVSNNTDAETEKESTSDSIDKTTETDFQDAIAAFEQEVRTPFLRSSLQMAVQRINREVKEIPTTSKLKPLTVAEVLSAIKSIEQQSMVKENAPPNWLSPAEFESLSNIVKTNRLPENITLRNFSRYCDGETMKHGSWIRLMLHRKSAGPFCLVVRSNEIFERPFTFIERLHRDSHTVLIGRLITYFKDTPNFGENPLTTAEYQQFAKQVNEAITKKELNRLQQLFHFESDETNSFRQGAIAELKKTLDRKVRNLTFVNRGFKGDLFHWQAGKTFKPNLPVEGYLRIQFTDNHASQPNELYLEVGAKDGEPRFVSYVTTSDQLKPGTKLSGNPSISGFYVQTVDGGLESGVNISAPTELRELEQANRELWLEKPNKRNAANAFDGNSGKEPPVGQADTNSAYIDFPQSVDGIAQAVRSRSGIMVMSPSESSATWTAPKGKEEVIDSNQCDRFAKLLLPTVTRMNASIRVHKKTNELRFVVSDGARCRSFANAIMFALVDLNSRQAVDDLLERERKKDGRAPFSSSKRYKEDAEGNVVELQLGEVELTNGEVEAIGSLKSLQRLSLSKTNVTDQQIRTMQRLHNLVELNLTGTQIGDESLNRLGSFPKLERLNLTKTKITDEGLHALRQFKSLRSLSIDRCRITDEGMKTLAELPRLETLKLSETSITDDAINFLKDSASLRGLVLAETEVSQAGLDSLSKLEQFSWIASEELTLRELARRLAEGDHQGVAQMETIGLHFPREGTFEFKKLTTIDVRRNRKWNRRRRMDFDWRKKEKTTPFYAIVMVDRGAVRVIQMGIEDREPANRTAKIKIGSVYGKPVFKSDLNPNVSAKDNLLRLFIQPLTTAYLKQHPEIDPEPELKKRIKDESTRAGVLMFVRMHRMHKHLHETYGGRVVVSAFGPFSIDAQAKWLTNLEESGDLELTHAALRKALDELKTVNDTHLIATPEQIAEVFDPKHAEQFIQNMIKSTEK